MTPREAKGLDRIIARYTNAFQAKLHTAQLGPGDLLMDVFQVTPEMKAGAPQYWSRELGMCWERLVREVFETHVPGCGGPLQLPTGSPCDITLEGLALDTKYRLGSGDAGTLKKLAGNAPLLKAMGYEPVMLFLREDSLPAARTRMERAGWRVIEGDASFEFVQEHTGQDLRAYLQRLQRAAAGVPPS